MQADELAIYQWINPTKPPDDVKRERQRMVALVAIRHGVHHYFDDIWQEWQLAVHQRNHMEPTLPVAEREVFTFGIARNLCRSHYRKEQRMVPILDPATSREEGSVGIREQYLARLSQSGGPFFHAMRSTFELEAA